MTNPSGTDFAASLPQEPSLAREQAIWEAVRRGWHRPLAWRRLQVSAAGHQGVLWVADDALKIGDADDSIRVNVTAQTGQWIADHLGASLCTKHISDLIWQQADVRLTPSIQTPDAQMAWTHRMVQHSQAVDAKLDARAGLVANVGKDWVLTNRLAAQPGRAANYGWFRSDGRPIQPLGLAHDVHHVDYSQVLRLVRREMEVDGREMDIEAVGRHPELAALVSDEGPLSVWRQPGIAAPPSGEVTDPEPDPQPATPPPAPDDPAGWRVLRKGMSGADVAAWQRVLMRDGHDLSPWNDDGAFGPVTHQATVAWQVARSLPGDGVVDRATKAAIGTAPRPNA